MNHSKDFYHFLHDTLILLGAGKRFANLMDNPESITQKDVDDLRNYNCKLIDNTKSKLANIHYIKIVKGDTP